MRHRILPALKTCNFQQELVIDAMDKCCGEVQEIRKSELVGYTTHIAYTAVCVRNALKSLTLALK